MRIKEGGSHHRFTFVACAAALSGVRWRINDILSTANIPKADVSAIVIALNEACMNIIQHAYHGDSAQCIEVHIAITDSQVNFELLDCAEPVDLAGIHGRPFNELRPGGLGVNFITELMSEVQYSHREDRPGNCLRMIWKHTAETEVG